MRSAVARRVRKQVIVTLKTGDAFGGVLWESDRTALVLRSSHVLTPPRAGEVPVPQPVDGELVLLLADVAFIQVL